MINITNGLHLIVSATSYFAHAFAHVHELEAITYGLFYCGIVIFIRDAVKHTSII